MANFNDAILMLNFWRWKVTYIRDEVIKRTNRRRAYFSFSNRSEDRTLHEQKELCLCFGFEEEEQSLYSGHVLTQHHVTQLGFNPGATIKPFKTLSLYLTDGVYASMIQTW